MLLKKTSRSWFIIYLLTYKNVAIGHSLTATATPVSTTQSNCTFPKCEKIREYENVKWNTELVNSGIRRRNLSSFEVGRKESDYDESWKWNSCLYDCKALDIFLAKRKGYGWAIVKFFNAFFRGISQVIIVNNPISGFLIWMGIFWSNFLVGVITSMAATAAIFTAWLIGQDTLSIREGLTTYNAVLVGSVISTLWPVLYNEPLSPKIVGMVAVGAVMSVFVNSGMGNILEHWDLPTLTLPFNIVAIILFAIFKPLPQTTTRSFSDNLHMTQHGTVVKKWQNTLGRNENVKISDLTVVEGRKKTLLENNTSDRVLNYLDLDLWKVAEGIIYSSGQVYAVQTLLGSVLIYIGCLIYSPILFAMSLVGATVGTFIGLLFTTKAPYTSVYTGIWGYNGVLAGIALGGFFFPLNQYSFLLAVLDVIFAVFIQQALSLAFTQTNLVVLTFPFCLATYMFVGVTTHEYYLRRVTQFTYPEKHLEDYAQFLRNTSTTTEHFLFHPFEPDIRYKNANSNTNRRIASD